jgi:hypothetical protein
MRQPPSDDLIERTLAKIRAGESLSYESYVSGSRRTLAFDRSERSFPLREQDTQGEDRTGLITEERALRFIGDFSHNELMENLRR